MDTPHAGGRVANIVLLATMLTMTGLVAQGCTAATPVDCAEDTNCDELYDWIQSEYGDPTNPPPNNPPEDTPPEDTPPPINPPGEVTPPSDDPPVAMPPAGGNGGSVLGIRLDTEAFFDVELDGCSEYPTVFDFEFDYIESKCQGCHGANLPSLRPGNEAAYRLGLVDRRAVDLQDDGKNSKCKDAKFVDPDNWENSVLYLVTKQESTDDILACPDDDSQDPGKMPQGGSPNDDETIKCMESYVKALIDGYKAM